MGSRLEALKQVAKRILPGAIAFPLLTGGLVELRCSQVPTAPPREWQQTGLFPWESPPIEKQLETALEKWTQENNLVWGEGIIFEESPLAFQWKVVAEDGLVGRSRPDLKASEITDYRYKVRENIYFYYPPLAPSVINIGKDRWLAQQLLTRSQIRTPSWIFYPVKVGDKTYLEKVIPGEN